MGFGLRATNRVEKWTSFTGQTYALLVLIFVKYSFTLRKISNNISLCVSLESSKHPEPILAKHCGKCLTLYLSSCPTLLHSPVCPPSIRVREAPVRVCVLTLAGARWAVPRWSPGPLDGRGCGCWGPCSPGWRESAAGWTHPPWAGSHSLQSEGGQEEEQETWRQLWNISAVHFWVYSVDLRGLCWASQEVESHSL